MDKRYDHQSAETDARQKWEQEKTYARENNPGKLYTIDTPPPTVSGKLHIGHIFSYTQTDIIARYKRMSGFSVFYPFGFDDNGLPTEKFVEKKRKVRAHELGRSEFIKLCLEETKEAHKEFKELWQRMGLSVNWDSCYSTISDQARAISQESFIKLYEKGFIYRKDEPALYCTTCRTSVAQAELDDVEKPSHFNDIVFKDEQGKDLIVGTTRPELLPSCVAMFYNPNDERYKHLKGKKATVPLFGQEVPILEDEHVDIEKGTGLVMCCTFGDKTDIEWFKNFNLPYKQSIGLDGKMTENTGILAGLKVAEARKKVLEELDKAGLLLRQKEITHAVNVHERCKKDIEFAVLQQWFIKITEHKQKFLDLADQINWYPTFMKARYRDWVEHLNWDWCISRQRFYGIPFPAWHCQDCNEVVLASIDQLPIDPQETQAPTCKCGSSNMQADTDVMDTWNTSALTPFLCYALFNPEYKSAIDEAAQEFLPMSMRPQAHDIIRTWAFYTVTRTWMHHEMLPWKDIIISGHVLAPDGQEKLSKSKTQKAMVPEQLLSTYPADVIRFWTASGSLGHDVPFSENQLKIGLKLITKLWNAFKFTKEHIAQAPAEKPADLGGVNEWILHEATAAFAQYQSYFKNNEFGLALQSVENFFWHHFCDNYLELIKDQLFNPDNYDAQQVAATCWTLLHVGLRILQLYAPYFPFITENLYGSLYGNGASIHQTRFEEVQKHHAFEDSANTMRLVTSVINKVRKFKSENQLSLKTELSYLTLVGTDETLSQLKQQEQLIKGIAHAKELLFEVGELDVVMLEHKEDETWSAKIGI